MSINLLFQRCTVFVYGFYGFGFKVACCSNIDVGFLNDHIEGNQTIVFNPAAIGPGLVHAETPFLFCHSEGAERPKNLSSDKLDKDDDILDSSLRSE